MSQVPAQLSLFRGSRAGLWTPTAPAPVNISPHRSRDLRLPKGSGFSHSTCKTHHAFRPLLSKPQVMLQPPIPGSSLIVNSPPYSGHLTLQHQPCPTPTPHQHTLALPSQPSTLHSTALRLVQITFIHNHSDPSSQRRQQLPRTNRKWDGWLPHSHPQARQPLHLGPFLASEMEPWTGWGHHLPTPPHPHRRRL